MSTNKTLVAITGNTFPVKEKLKALGAKWNAEDKCWMVSESKAAEAQAIVAGAGPKKPSTGSSYYRGNNGFRREQECKYGGDCLSFIRRLCSACR